MNKRNYEYLSDEMSERIRQDIANGTRPQFAAVSSDAKRRNNDIDKEVEFGQYKGFNMKLGFSILGKNFYVVLNNNSYGSL